LIDAGEATSCSPLVRAVSSGIITLYAATARLQKPLQLVQTSTRIQLAALHVQMGPTNKNKELEQHARAALVQDWLPSDKDDKATYNAKKMTMLNIMAINNTLAIEDTRKDVHGVKAQSLEIRTMMENLGKQYEAMEKAQKGNQERMDQLGKLLEENKRFTEDTRRENQSLGEHVRDLVGQSAQVENRVSTLFGNESGRIDALKTLIASLENRLENQAQRDEFKSEQFARLDERVKLVQELQMLAASAPTKSREVLDRIGDIREFL
jgi:hypothetical protein